MDRNEATLEQLFASFSACDGEGMAACYSPQAAFRDPVFRLQGANVGHMWRMLCRSARDLRLNNVEYWLDERTGEAHWEAEYTFSKTGRKVRNQVASRFVFRDGLIFEQYDSFNFWRWTRMALGPVGALLGWTPALKGKVRRDAKRRLDEFVIRNAKPASRVRDVSKPNGASSPWKKADVRAGERAVKPPVKPPVKPAVKPSATSSAKPSAARRPKAANPAKSRK